MAEVIQHGGNPRQKVRELLERHKSGNNARLVVTGQAARLLLDLPYRAETECLEKALAFHDLKPDILLSLGGP